MDISITLTQKQWSKVLGAFDMALDQCDFLKDLSEVDTVEMEELLTFENEIGDIGVVIEMNAKL